MSSNDEIIDALEALFAAVVTKARSDKAFARQLAKALGDPKRLLSTDGARAEATAAIGIDPRALLALEGAEGLRRALAALNRRELNALVRAQGLAPAQASRLNKTEIIEHVARTLVRESKPPARPFDY